MITPFAIGQHLFAGFAGTEIPADFAALVRQYQIGNVVLFAHNVQDAPQLRRLCGELRALVLDATGVIPLIAIDQEGGIVSRLGEDAAVVPSAMAVAATGEPEDAYQAGLITGTELRAMGVNFDLAPVLDVNSNPHNPVIGVRSYGQTPEQVAHYGIAMMRGLLDGGVLACGKHFPGHGDTAVDSHVGLPLVDKSLAGLEACELAPFRAAITAGLPAVMSSHILFPQLEPDKLPATMSRRVMTGLLKERLGFDGLVLSDCMMMGAIADHYGSVAGMVAALKAGVDMVFASHSAQLAGEAAQAIAAELAAGALSDTEFAASTEKILRYKAQHGEQPTPDIRCVGSAEHRARVAQLYEQSLTAVQLPKGGMPPLGAHPLFIACPPWQVTPASSAVRGPASFAEYMHAAFGGDMALMPADPDDAQIAQLVRKAPGHTCLVVGTYNGHLRPGQLRLVQALGKLSLPMICVALRNPYDLAHLPPHAAGIATYGANAGVMAALEKLLRGDLQANGTLPVHLAR